jgi:hypothetical protein
MSGGKREIVAVNEYGKRIGSSHHNAKHSDEIVDAIRDMHEDEGIGYRKLAIIFSLPRATIQKICTYERRAQTPVRYKTIRKEDKS